MNALRYASLRDATHQMIQKRSLQRGKGLASVPRGSRPPLSDLAENNAVILQFSLPLHSITSTYFALLVISSAPALSV